MQELLLLFLYSISKSLNLHLEPLTTYRPFIQKKKKKKVKTFIVLCLFIPPRSSSAGLPSILM
ncbi:hypothetical protein DsansV1_C05g0054841 [Dioscorea sansibarensis]